MMTPRTAASLGRPLASTYRITSSHLGALKTASGLAYRDWSFPDGYTYRQYKGGDITILKSPRSTTTTTLSADVPSQRKAWEAITAQIRMAKAGRTAADIRAAGMLVTVALTAITPKRRRRGHRRPRVEHVEPVEEPKPFPWLWVGIAVAAVIVVASSGKG